MTNTFIELDYTGRAEDGVFDTTRKEDAPAGSKGPFGPITVKIGSGQLLPGLDEFLKGKTKGEYTVTIPAEKAFGKKDAKLLKLVPLTTFGKEKNRLEPGLPIRIGEQHGVVKSMSGGRVVVDFNHPLAGKDVHYTLYVHGEVTEPQKKVEAILKSMLGVALPVTMEGEKAIIALPAGFPSDGIVAELEKHTGVKIGVKELEMPKHEHAHTHDHHHEHGHDHHDHKH